LRDIARYCSDRNPRPIGSSVLDAEVGAVEFWPKLESVAEVGVGRLGEVQLRNQSSSDGFKFNVRRFILIDFLFLSTGEGGFKNPDSPLPLSPTPWDGSRLGNRGDASAKIGGAAVLCGST
jgi:hypothetical protein